MFLASFWKSQAMVENAKIQKFKCDFFSNFQTMWQSEVSSKRSKKTFKSKSGTEKEKLVNLFLFCCMIKQ